MVFIKSADDLPADFGHVDGMPDPRDKQIADLEAALRQIAKMKSEPIGDTGFATGPLALFQACQRIAREALRK